jgi:hypothetical protein
MKRFATLSLIAVALAMPSLARAEGGEGSRQGAGGGHMSSFVSDPYHNPKSLHSQMAGTGQIGGSPMYNDGAVARNTVARRDVISPNWASGFAPRRIAR